MQSKRSRRQPRLNCTAPHCQILMNLNLEDDPNMPLPDKEIAVREGGTIWMRYDRETSKRIGRATDGQGRHRSQTKITALSRSLSTQALDANDPKSKAANDSMQEEILENLGFVRSRDCSRSTLALARHCAHVRECSRIGRTSCPLQDKVTSKHALRVYKSGFPKDTIKLLTKAQTLTQLKAMNTLLCMKKGDTLWFNNTGE
eukprot:SAG11_NODE_474_length_9142_cov_6.507907_9_plen_202_part_00